MKNNYYIELGLIFGAGIGLCIGIIADNLAIWISLGSGVGLVLGAAIRDSNKKKEK